MEQQNSSLAGGYRGQSERVLACRRRVVDDLIEEQEQEQEE